MGKKPVKVEFINDPKKRKMTFKKRKLGLLKKARELSIMSGVNIEVTFGDENKSKEIISNLKNINSKLENIESDEKFYIEEQSNFNYLNEYYIDEKAILNDVYLR